MATIHEDRSILPLASWLVESLSEALSRMDGIERNCYFFVFDRLCDILEDRDELGNADLDALWQELEPVLDRLAEEAGLLGDLSRMVADLELVNAEGPKRPGTVWQPQPDRVYLWARDHGGLHGYRVSLGHKKWDRYDNGVTAVTFDETGAETDVPIEPFVAPPREAAELAMTSAAEVG